MHTQCVLQNDKKSAILFIIMSMICNMEEAKVQLWIQLACLQKVSIIDEHHKIHWNIVKHMLLYGIGPKLVH